ncbi:MAG: lysoplasmalogenase [Acidobacteria bacterium]|nr:lysoplasmalogenase [Acidobacteriota bacterium]
MKFNSLLALFVGLGILHLLFIVIDFSRGRHFTKILLIPLLMFWVYSIHPVYLLLLALFWGWIGDVLLIKKDKSLFLKLGLLAFLLGHLSCISVFLLHTSAVPGILSSVGIIFVYLLFGSGMFRVLNSGLGRMKVPVGIYIFVISCMSVAALTFALSNGGKTWFSFAGSLLFVFSDSVLAFQLFRKPFKYGRFLVMASYIPAQFLLAFGILHG